VIADATTAETEYLSYELTTAQPPAMPIAIAPATGTIAGGTHVVIQVVNSVGIISAQIDGVNLTGFAIDDATHVSGDTVAHVASPSGVSVNVSNAYAMSAPLVNTFVYV
jgi:hypothetical protein